MRKKITRLLMFIMVIMVALIPASNVQAATVKLNKTAVTLYEGKTVTLKMQGTSKKVTWKTSKKTVATVSTKGVVTAKKAGTATITAKVGNKTYKCKVTVKKPYLNKSKETLYEGKTTTLKMVGTSKKTTWKTSNKTVATVSAKGVVTAKKKGTAVISATVGGKTYKCTITVKKPYLNKTSVTLDEKKTVKLVLTGATIKSVKSSNPSVATVTVKGVVTAKKEGAAKITITDTKGRTYVCVVIVNKVIKGPSQEEIEDLMLPSCIRMSIDDMSKEDAEKATILAKSMLWFFMKGERDTAYEFAIAYESNIGANAFRTIMEDADEIMFFGEKLVAIPDEIETQVISLANQFEAQVDPMFNIKYSDSDMLHNVGVCMTMEDHYIDQLEDFHYYHGLLYHPFYMEYYYMKMYYGFGEAELLKNFTGAELTYLDQVRVYLDKVYNLCNPYFI